MSPEVTKKIKVVFVINDFLVGGAQKLLIDILSRIDKQTFDPVLVTLFSFTNRETLYDALPAAVPVHRLAFSGVADLVSWYGLYKLVRREKPDVLCSHLFFANMVARIIGAVRCHPVISTVHNTYKNHTFGQIVIDKVLSYLTSRIIAVSETVKTFTAAQEHIPLGKFVVIPNGIDVKGLQERVRALDRAATLSELGLDPNGRYMISVARMTPQKNIPLLIEAFDVFVRTHSEYHLLVIGGGGMLDGMQRQASLLLSASQIHFFGSRKDVFRFLSVADFFVSTSDIEGFGIAHIEAMACGLPVVTTKTAGPDRFVIPGRNGFFVESNIASVAQGMQQTAEEDIVRLGECARRIAEGFDIQETVRRYERLIRQVAHPSFTDS